MRWIIGAAACAVLGLVGCNASSALSDDTKAFTAGVAAFKAGDRTALDTAMTTLKVRSDDPAPCSPEAFAAARRSAFRQILEPLDRSAILSMPEEARFVFLSGAIGRGVEDAASPAQACKDQKDVGLLAVQDTVERVAALKAVIETTKSWHEALAARHGKQLDARLMAAARMLAANHFDVGYLQLRY
ncbi:uncharacterized small protein (DUF1192 family) [Caulobacter ginsengisoli]|uniref:Uncharacterized small protein (DUF1192 family) n=1 Tax=Caulobacter ginsengisoli TaxID=400775 RepID=A0ABU0IMQ8_9CAUL|nr:hypothetical protein [Caulobacter ginsengisoli]MDQ0463296.1 uncharacterized small protein (DUF1192 family) [Caulobacter ginsengisoli]